MQLLGEDSYRVKAGGMASMAQRACPGCGMPENNWTANDGKGHPKDGKTYCCQGCAEAGRCTCGIKAGIGI